MRAYKNSYYLLIVISFCSLFYFSSCDGLFDNKIWPRNKIIALYTSPQINSYKIRSVALLPMMPDDTTDVGTFYSTNHFINSLEEEYPNIKIYIPDIDSAIAIDSLAITNVIYSIEEKKKLDLKIFSNSSLAYDVMKDSTDAMIIGMIDSCITKQGSMILDSYINKTRIISCCFTYYLISLEDGRVLWRAKVQGEAGYIYYGSQELYPPLDYALSEGINLLIKKIPLN